MSEKVILHIKNGIAPDRKIVFPSRAVCSAGRAEDCFLRFPQPDISRRHCLLVIDPPSIHIRDLGSRNGTFVNGKLIGQRPQDESPEEVEMRDYDLQEGDEVRIGSALISVSLEEAAYLGA
jgi:pSer/pThr/pTyr-binding forkhead associated (FHA) protein